jgi:hypothetical protein
MLLAIASASEMDTDSRSRFTFRFYVLHPIAQLDGVVILKSSIKGTGAFTPDEAIEQREG